MNDLPPVGLIPAAGRAERLGPLPCSKELLPIGFRETPRGPAPKVAGHYLLERFRTAGVRRVFMVLHESKQDVPRYFGTGEIADVALAYLSIPGSRSVPETLDRAFPFVEESIVALGFPDVIFEPADAYAPLIARQAATGADLVLGLFPAERFRSTDMVELGEDGRVVRVEVRPESTALRYNWLIAVWSPVSPGSSMRPCGTRRPAKGSSRSAPWCGPPSRQGSTSRASSSRRGGTATSGLPPSWRRPFASTPASRPVLPEYCPRSA